MLNSTRTALAPNIFSAIIGLILLSIVAVICAPFLAQAVYNAGVIHRNFRIQVRLIATVFLLATSSRFVLLYYQLFDNKLEDKDYFLIVVNIVRDVSFGYQSIIIHLFLPPLIIYRYERQTPGTMAALFLIELSNLLPAVTNSTGWILGYWGFTFNVVFLMFTVIIGGAVSAFCKLMKF
ncbi:hypothetical protein PENTCL1PPCAC_14238 [Pristionchus entomophagus]|uniref:G protein-coupled receptor n=1 Tax=Pristionchus entomophagus TaxID=358040 RepID=A0AAV5TDD3_9BILA|nr:hypothetical protein PENTCL1PPCAC_14238 [Pristionchus entomophagus]